MLSAFLDKMVIKGPGHDFSTMSQINNYLDRPPNQAYESTSEAFAQFMRALQERGIQDFANEHLRLQVRPSVPPMPVWWLCALKVCVCLLQHAPEYCPTCALRSGLPLRPGTLRPKPSRPCPGTQHPGTQQDSLQTGANDLAARCAQAFSCDPDSVQYQYRLEDIAQWMPCFIDGNKLRNFTLARWQQKPLLRYAGPEGTDCWWKPPGMACEEWLQAATGPDGRLVPLEASALPAVAADLTGHHTSAGTKLQVRAQPHAFARGAARACA
jgi:hypothetical protein